MDEHRLIFALVEDDVMVRRSLTLLLQHQFPDHRVEAFEAGAPAVAFCQSETVQLLLTDLGLPDMDGLDLIRELRTTGSTARMIVMTGTPTDALPRELWDLGVAGFIDKSSLSEHVRAAVERVLAGGMYFSAQVTPERLNRGTGEQSNPTVDLAGMSDRERDVARLVASGLLSKEIADQLHLSPRTVEKYRTRVMKKVGVRSVPQLVHWCLRQGLV